MSEALLLVGNSSRDLDLRHEVRAAVPDGMIWLCAGEDTTLWGSPFDVEPLRDAGAVADVRSVDELGYREVRRDPGTAPALLFAELARRALERAGVSGVRVPGGFPLAVADHLRASGVAVSMDDERFADRRRQKRDWELEGMRAAGRAAQAALLEGAAVLRGGVAGVTCEGLRERMVRVLLDHGAESEEILIHAGAGMAGGHALGFGPVEEGLPVQIDMFPRHRASGLYVDMSRTWVVGAPRAEVARHWNQVREALALALAHAKPGEEDLYGRVAGYFEERGHPTQRRPGGGLESAEEGFTPSLGHGVGLDVHEAPILGLRRDPLREGDVVAIEPSLGYEGIGFVMLEDTVMVAPGGAEHLLEPLPYELAVPGS